MSDNRIFFAESEKYGFLALSVDAPRFCVAGATKEEAKERASEFLHAYHSEIDEIEAARNRYIANDRVSAPHWIEEEKIYA